MDFLHWLGLSIADCDSEPALQFLQRRHPWVTHSYRVTTFHSLRNFLVSVIRMHAWYRDNQFGSWNSVMQRSERQRSRGKGHNRNNRNSQKGRGGGKDRSEAAASSSDLFRLPVGSASAGESVALGADDISFFSRPLGAIQPHSRERLGPAIYAQMREAAADVDSIAQMYEAANNIGRMLPRSQDVRDGFLGPA